MVKVLSRCFLGLFLLSCAGAAQAQSIKFVTGNNYFPYSHQRMDGGGLATVYVRAVVEAMGITPEFEFMGWEDGYQAALVGRYVGTFPYIYSEERKEQFHYSDPIFAVRPYIFTTARKFGGVGPLKSLKGATLCVPKGWAVDGDLQEQLDKGEIQVRTGNSVLGCFKALRNGHVHAISIDRRLGTIAARTVDQENYWYIAERLSDESNPHYLIVSRQVPNGRAWLDKFNEALNSQTKCNTGIFRSCNGKAVQSARS